MGGDRGRAVLAAARPRGRRSPSSPAIASHRAGGGMQQEQVDVAPVGQRAQDLEMAGRQAGEPEQRQARGQLAPAPGRSVEPLTGAPPALGRAGHADPGPQPAPQLGLPGRARGQQAPAERVEVLALRPGLDHRRTVQRVAVKQVGEMAHRRSAAGRPRIGVGRIAVATRDSGPGWPARARPGAPARPRAAARPPARAATGPRSGSIPEAAATASPSRRCGEGELDVGADPVAAARRRRRAGRHALGQPALHPARRHRHDLGGERIGQRPRPAARPGRRRGGRRARLGGRGASHADSPNRRRRLMPERRRQRRTPRTG